MLTIAPMPRDSAHIAWLREHACSLNICVAVVDGGGKRDEEEAAGAAVGAQAPGDHLTEGGPEP
jgi:hypothetical protein